MDCANCGRKAEKGWNHCPNCGSALGSRANHDVFSNIFKEMEEMTKGMGLKADMDMEVIDLSQIVNDMVKKMSQPAARKGFSIRIHQKNNEHPKVMFRKFGDGSQNAGQVVYPKLRKPAEGKQPSHKIGIKLPRDTKEPETEIKKSGNRLIVDISLPGVKDAGSIDIDELESSVEVKAVAGGKGYFKIIKKPEFSKVVKKSFSGGALHLEML